MRMFLKSVKEPSPDALTWLAGQIIDPLFFYTRASLSL